MSTAAPTDRVVAIDALRGFDMFWITGGREIVLGALAIFVHPFPQWLSYQASHVEWVGFSAWDMIMPLFLFIVGAAMPFSFSKRVGPGESYGPVYRKIARRVILLWILGTIAQGNLISSLASMDFSKLHLYSNTLQAIASGYVIGALALLHLPRWGQAFLGVGLLVAYWAALTFIPFGGHAAGVLEPRDNFALLIDETLLGRFRDGTTYTWILSSLGFGATVLMGIFAGHTLRGGASKTGKLGLLVAAGLTCLALGAGFALVQPIIKHIWTPAMVLWSGGWCYLLLALFYALMDIAGYKRWAFPFMVVGANAIVAYMLGELFVHYADDYIADPLSSWTGVNELLAGLAAFGVLWLGLYVMYKKRIFVRV